MELSIQLNINNRLMLDEGGPNFFLKYIYI